MRNRQHRNERSANARTFNREHNAGSIFPPLLASSLTLVMP
jgi:hypothetical protein